MMKSILGQILPLCTAALAALAKANAAQQELLVGEDMMPQQDNNKVPGHNDAIYDIVPKEDQIYKIKFLKVDPTPIVADRVISVYLGGNLPEPKKKELALLDEGLINATLSVSASVVYADGSHDDEKSYTIPLKTTSFGNAAQLTVREGRGYQVDYMPTSGDSAILAELQIFAMFLRTGMWTFKVDARLGDAENTCLFAMSLTQWLEGRL